MRPTSIFFIFAFATASHAGSVQLGAHEANDLFVRATGPKTMDPARLSILSILKTAIASDPAFPRPTGDFEPEWYQKLPEDVKQILPSLYPAAVDASSSSSAEAAASSPSWTSQVTVTKTLHHAPSSATDHGLSSNSSASAVCTSYIQTAASISTSPTMPAAGGVKAVVPMEEKAVYAWIGLATAFFLFA
ncbi:hypothetical protein FB567DRAFT_57027 [Paraphoma chrysanthemicola]|uniref:Uncharacterized protein n=1 Tax=Paraphoma chrysanthemicola TaxID=798071 RepID=A0A8K0VY13_9PLEO|nr:hypothetical protein FB567DRAFT_57027 [Paraphoma chrysanthemicola]